MDISFSSDNDHVWEWKSLLKVGLDFSSGSYAHTGLRFRIGAYLLPVILIVVFVYGWLTTSLPVGRLLEKPLPFPESQMINEDEQSSIK